MYISYDCVPLQYSSLETPYITMNEDTVHYNGEVTNWNSGYGHCNPDCDITFCYNNAQGNLIQIDTDSLVMTIMIWHSTFLLECHVD